MTDQTLGDTTPDEQPTTSGSSAGGAFAYPEQHSEHEWTIDDILAAAELPERRAHICLKANLQATYDDLVAELSTLVDAQGRPLVDDEASIGDVTAESRAVEINEQIATVRLEMNAAMWHPLFRGISTDDLAVFNKKYAPKGDDLTGYHDKLIAETSCDPKLSVDQVASLRKKLGHNAFRQLLDAANWVCMNGGVDVPKSPGSSLSQQRR